MSCLAISCHFVSYIMSYVLCNLILYVLSYMIIGCYPEAKRKYDFFCVSISIEFGFFQKDTKSIWVRNQYLPPQMLQ